MYYESIKGDDANESKHGRIMIRLPDESKQTSDAEKKAARACMEHEIEGAEVVDWGTGWATVSQETQRRAFGHTFRSTGNGWRGSEQRCVWRRGGLDRKGVLRHGECGHQRTSDRARVAGRRAYDRTGDPAELLC